MTGPALGSMDVAARIPRLVDRLGEAGPDGEELDALLVCSLTNIRYLTGFTGSAALLLVHPERLAFLTDGRYREQSSEQLAAAHVDAQIEVSNDEQKELLSAIVTELGVKVLGLESEHVTWARQRSFAGEWFEGIDLIPTKEVVEDLRLVKDRGEVARISAAAGIADQALATVRSSLGSGITERGFALALDTEMRKLGAVAPSFDTIVASGPNGALPHAQASERVISDGDLVVLDFGALVDGYCSDMSRTVMVGKPSADQQRMLDVVREAQRAGVAAVHDGVAARDVDKACREVIEGHGLGDAFVHSTGHGVGLDIHEQPRLGPKSEATLSAGNVVTVEPGVYLPDHGGVRIEDTVVVTEQGCEPLTRAPKATSV